MPYTAARSAATFFWQQVSEMEVLAEYILFSHTYTTGSFHSPAAFIVSW